MPRPMKNEKAKDFKGSIKRLLKNMKQWRILLIIAIFLAFVSSIFSLISPNKISDMTDVITKGITPDTETFTLIGNKISENLNKNMSKAPIVFLDKEVSKEDIEAFQKGEINIVIYSKILEDIKINDVLVSGLDQAKTLRILSEIGEDKEDALRKMNELPTSIYELVKPKIDMKKIYEIALFLLILYIVSALFSFIQNFLLCTVSNKFAKNLRSRISNKINILPLKYFDTHETGDILSRVTNDVDMISHNLNNSLSNLVSSLTLFLGCVIMMFYTNGYMAMTAILSSILGFVFMFVVLGKSQKYFNQKQVELGLLNGHIEEVYSGHTVVKAYNGEEEAILEFEKRNKNLYNCNQKSQFLSGLMPSMMGFIGNLGYVAVCVVGAILVMNHSISFGVIVAFMMYVRLFTSPLSQIAQAMTSLQSTAAASERVFEFLEEEEMVNEKELTMYLDPASVKGNIEFKNVTFGYTEGKTIIKDFNLKASSGEKIAIVGPTGAGKTTLVNLLMKFYDIKEGDILIDGVSISSLTRENIHDLFTMVLQDTWLFDGSVKENIKFNKQDIKEEEVLNALKVVGVDHFVRTLPGGVDAMIDDGDFVSGGQKQLLTIARGMVKNSPFLILDEATSNVDTRTEELVQKAMDKLTEGKTSFIIAHRLSTIKNANTIIVMKDGSIKEIGDHDSLMKKNGFYAELYNSQFKK